MRKAPTRHLCQEIRWISQLLRSKRPAVRAIALSGPRHLTLATVMHRLSLCQTSSLISPTLPRLKRFSPSHYWSLRWGRLLRICLANRHRGTRLRQLLGKHLPQQRLMPQSMQLPYHCHTAHLSALRVCRDSSHPGSQRHGLRASGTWESLAQGSTDIRSKRNQPCPCLT